MTRFMPHTTWELLLCQYEKHFSNATHDWKNDSLFCTKAVFCGLHCTLVLDNVSSKSFVSRDFDLRLDIKNFQLLNRFFISWLHQGNTLEVSARC